MSTPIRGNGSSSTSTPGPRRRTCSSSIRQVLPRCASRGWPATADWSYPGTDVLHIAADQPTMNLDRFTRATRDFEFIGSSGTRPATPWASRTSTCATRSSPGSTARRRRPTSGGPRAGARSEVVAQVLTPLPNSAPIATDQADPQSIMCYWLPAEVDARQRAGRRRHGHRDPQDAQFAARVHIRSRTRSRIGWNWTTTPHTGWLRVDGNPATADVVAGGAGGYQRPNTGRICVYTG